MSVNLLQWNINVLAYTGVPIYGEENGVHELHVSGYCLLTHFFILLHFFSCYSNFWSFLSCYNNI